jgi:antitoxin (DNA-binding transcriptional repressor) of toxin-antitoxin stability system
MTPTIAVATADVEAVEVAQPQTIQLIFGGQDGLATDVSVELLHPQTTQLIRRVHEGQERIEIMYEGETIARVVWEQATTPVTDAQMAQVLANLHQLSEEISANWPEGVSAPTPQPAPDTEDAWAKRAEEIWPGLTELTAQIGATWEGTVSSVEMVREGRREL